MRSNACLHLHSYIDDSTRSLSHLEPRHVRLTNFSCIDASVRAFMNERKSLWSVHPKVIHLSPQAP